MTTGLPSPPKRHLSSQRLQQRKQHLLQEITAPARTNVAAPLRWRWRSRRRAAFAAAVGLAAVAIIVGVVLTSGATGTASAAEVRAKIARALQFRQNISGEFEVQTRLPGPRPRGLRGCQNCTPMVPQPSRFVIGADGSYSSLTLPLDAKQRDDVAYNAPTGVETSIPGFSDPNNGKPVYLRSWNLDPAEITYGPEARLGAWVLGALANHNPHVDNTTLDGRKAWKLTVTFIPGQNLFEGYGARVDVVIDQETGLVLQVTQYAYDTKRWTSIETMHNLKIGVDTRAADFTVPKPPGTVEIQHNLGFKRVPVSAAAAIVGYKPLLPRDTGRRKLVDFAVAKTTNPVPPIPGYPYPPYHDAIGARYGDNPDSITVSTRRGRVTELLTNSGLGSARPLHLRGVLKGDYAYVSTDPLRRTLVAAFHRGLIIKITANSAREAIRAAESL
jgi:hypothetical protein